MGSDENERDLVHAPVLRHLDVVVVDGVEARLVLQAEDEDDGVDPGSELKRENRHLSIIQLIYQFSSATSILSNIWVLKGSLLSLISVLTSTIRRLLKVETDTCSVLTIKMAS